MVLKKSVPVIFEPHCTSVPFPARAKTFFSSLKTSRPALGPSQPPVQRVLLALFSRKESDCNVKLTSHLHLMPRLRMSAAITSLPHVPAWRAWGHLYLSTVFLAHSQRKLQKNCLLSSSCLTVCNNPKFSGWMILLRLTLADFFF